ncbi:MAG: tRNA lysidine(34) synthetase TilS [Myxococcota bacterium]
MSRAAPGDVVSAVREALDGPCAVPRGTRVMAACSGGADSVALVDALARLSDRWPLAGVAFVDHGLRDMAREREAARQAAERAGVPLTERRLDLPRRGNRQAAARRARYAALLEVTPDDGALATGHTRTDQAETVLQRLVRGAGLQGLAGIRPREGRVVRPLLAVSRSTTRGLDQPFADDPTNRSGDYQRNRIRRDVFPLLATENPRVEEALSRVADQARTELELIDALMNRIDSQAPDLRGSDPALAEAWVRWRLRREQRRTGASRAAVSHLAEHLVRGSDAAAVSLGSGRRGLARRGRLTLEADPDPRKVLVAPGPGSYRHGHVTLIIEEAPHAAGSTHPEPTRDEVRLDPARVVWPLRLRPEPSDGPDAPMPTAGAPAETRWVLLDGAGKRLWRSDVPPPPPIPEARARLRVRLLRDPRVVPR